MGPFKSGSQHVATATAARIMATAPRIFAAAPEELVDAVAAALRDQEGGAMPLAATGATTARGKAAKGSTRGGGGGTLAVCAGAGGGVGAAAGDEAADAAANSPCTFEAGTHAPVSPIRTCVAGVILPSAASFFRFDGGIGPYCLPPCWTNQSWAMRWLLVQTRRRGRDMCLQCTPLKRRSQSPRAAGSRAKGDDNHDDTTARRGGN
jgi:hypothetical protein